MEAKYVVKGMNASLEFYPATISKRVSDTTFDLRYDDGDTATGVHMSHMRDLVGASSQKHRTSGLGSTFGSAAPRTAAEEREFMALKGTKM